jgi:hypothetical protein
MAVLPTPGSPIRTGLFLVLRANISMVVSISFARPMTGSSFPSLASFVKSLEYLSSSGVALCVFTCPSCAPLPTTLTIFCLTDSGVKPFYAEGHLPYHLVLQSTDE